MLRFFKITGKTCGKVQIYLPSVHLKKRSAKALFDDIYAIFSDFCIKAYVVDTHLNCIDKSMQFKWVPTTYAFIKKVDKKYTDCDLKITKLFDCALIVVCAVIRSNTVCFLWRNKKKNCYPISPLI